MIRLVGPGGAGKTTTGALLGKWLGLEFVDLDQQFAAACGDVSEYLAVHGYASYASQNVQIYRAIIRTVTEPVIVALSSGFMTYADDVHPDYVTLRRVIAADPATIVLIPSLDYETCVIETVRRQVGRPFSRSAEREDHVIRERFGIYRSLAATKIETMRPVAEVVQTVMTYLLSNKRLQPTVALL